MVKITLNLSEEAIGKVKEEAEKEKRSVSKEVEWVIEKVLSEEGQTL